MSLDAKIPPNILFHRRLGIARLLISCETEITSPLLLFVDCLKNNAKWCLRCLRSRQTENWSVKIELCSCLCAPQVPRLSLLSADIISQLRNGPQGGGSWASCWVQRCDGQNPSGCQNRRLRLKCFERHLHISVIYILIFQTARILFFFMICISFQFSDFPPHEKQDPQIWINLE